MGTPSHAPQRQIDGSATKARFEIQARLLQRRDGALVRDEARLARADTVDDAVRAARAFAADGFTVWIYRVERGTGIQPTYRSVQTLRPERKLAAGPKPKR